MSCPFPARSCIHSCTARACTLMRAHADTHNNLHPPLLGPRSPHSHLLPSSTLLNFPAPALLSPFYPPSLIVSYGIQVRRQVRWNHVHNVSTGFHSVYLGGGVVQHPFGNSQNIVFSNKLLTYPAGLHLLRTVRFYALRTEGNRSRRNRELHFHLFCCQKRNLPPCSREMCLPPNG